MEPKDKKKLRIKSPEINLSINDQMICINDQMIFNNGAKTIQRGRDSLSTNDAEKIRNPLEMHKNEIGPGWCDSVD